MQTHYHVEITRRALKNHFSETALAAIVKANIKQDRIAYSFGHDHIHFDGSAFDKGFQYISLQEQLIYKHAGRSDFELAREAFGRMIHSWQDFYSHSNYVELWLGDNQNAPPEAIVIDDPKIINHPDLTSGKNYGLSEFFALLPVISRLILPLMPPDSHARMNLDQPSSSQNFYYAYWAALKQTSKLFDHVIQGLKSLDYNHNIISHFTDKKIAKKRYNHEHELKT